MSRSPLAGKIIIPPMAKSASGKTWSSCRAASATAFVARSGDRGARGREGVGDPTAEALDHDDEGQPTEQDDDRLHDDRRTVHDDGTEVIVRIEGPITRSTPRAATRLTMLMANSIVWRQPPRRERLDEHADDRAREDDEHRGDRDVVDRRRRVDGRNCGGGDHLALPFTAPTARGVGDPDVPQRLADGRIDDVERDLGVEAEHEEEDDERRDDPALTAGEVGDRAATAAVLAPRALDVSRPGSAGRSRDRRIPGRSRPRCRGSSAHR